MAIFVNSGKKVAYFKETLESLSTCHSKMVAAIEEMGATSKGIRAAAIDRAYNCAVDMGFYMNEGIVAAGKASVEILAELETKTAIGAALVAEAKKIKEEAEAVAALKIETPKVPAGTIAERGLDENWTDATVGAFAEAAANFIAARREMIGMIADITTKNAEEDFKDVYMTIGRHLEAISNNTVDAYNELKSQLELAGHGLSASVDAAVEAAGTVGGAVDNNNAKVDLTGEVMDV